MTEYATEDILDVVIVGAGPAGLGCALALDRLKLQNYAVLERGKVGESFRRWPREMRLLTPSFCGHAFGQLDLNAITPGTSPGYSLNKEHPSGREYANYLRDVAAHFELPVNEGVDVTRIEATSDNPDVGFELHSAEGILPTKFLIWAGGEFQFPKLDSFPGAEFCLHNSQVASWRELDGAEHIVIGGAESGIDAAVSLCQFNKRVTVLSREATWESSQSDPSVALTPFTLERLRKARATERLNLEKDVDVSCVEQTSTGFIIYDNNGRSWKSATRPILAAGFQGSVLHGLVADLFERRDDGFPLLNEWDESTVAPGLFLAGPLVRHEKVILCFIYKYRQRFAIIADQIGRRLGLDTTSLVEEYRKAQMFLDDFACCGEDCVC